MPCPCETEMKKPRVIYVRDPNTFERKKITIQPKKKEVHQLASTFGFILGDSNRKQKRGYV